MGAAKSKAQYTDGDKAIRLRHPSRTSQVGMRFQLRNESIDVEAGSLPCGRPEFGNTVQVMSILPSSQAGPLYFGRNKRCIVHVMIIRTTLIPWASPSRIRQCSHGREVLDGWRPSRSEQRVPARTSGPRLDLLSIPLPATQKLIIAIQLFKLVFHSATRIGTHCETDSPL